MIERQWKNADVYLIFNEGPEVSTHEMTLMGTRKRIEVWDPQTGEITPMKAVKSKAGSTVKITLQSYQTNVLVVQSRIQ
jgi:hypothetical protein